MPVAGPVRAAQSNGNGEKDPSFVFVTLDTPASLAVSSAEPGVLVNLTGSVEYNRVQGVEVRVVVGSMQFDATIGAEEAEGTWHCPVRFYYPGQIKVKATAHGHTIAGGQLRTAESPQLMFAVTLASAAPRFTILRPEPGKRAVAVSEATGAEIPLAVSASTGFGPRWVRWECEGQEGALREDPPGAFNGAVSLRPLPLGPRVVTVTCRDAGGNQAAESVTITAFDNTPPRLAILNPPPYRSFIGGPERRHCHCHRDRCRRAERHDRRRCHRRLVAHCG